MQNNATNVWINRKIVAYSGSKLTLLVVVLTSKCCHVRHFLCQNDDKWRQFVIWVTYEAIYFFLYYPLYFSSVKSPIYNMSISWFVIYNSNIGNTRYIHKSQLYRQVLVSRNIYEKLFTKWSYALRYAELQFQSQVSYESYDSMLNRGIDLRITYAEKGKINKKYCFPKITNTD